MFFVVILVLTYLFWQKKKKTTQKAREAARAQNRNIMKKNKEKNPISLDCHFGASRQRLHLCRWPTSMRKLFSFIHWFLGILFGLLKCRRFLFHRYFFISFFFFSMPFYWFSIVTAVCNFLWQWQSNTFCLSHIYLLHAIFFIESIVLHLYPIWGPYKLMSTIFLWFKSRNCVLQHKVLCLAHTIDFWWFDAIST